ncbi:MAG: NusG domain II-containing protein [Candidatus Fermentibacteraceae bacterium]
MSTGSRGNSPRPDRARRYPWIRPLDPLLVLAGLVPLVLGITAGGAAPGGRMELVWPAGSDTISLSRDTVVSLPGQLGPVRVEVTDGRARIARSPCPGQDCVRAGWLESTGDMSVCMPSGVLIRVIGTAEGGGPDALTY